MPDGASRHKQLLPIPRRRAPRWTVPDGASGLYVAFTLAISYVCRLPFVHLGQERSRGRKRRGRVACTWGRGAMISYENGATRVVDDVVGGVDFLDPIVVSE